MECLPCGKKFTGYENYEQHLESEKHKKKTLCTEERQNDSSANSEINISSNSEYNEVIKCPVCDLSFDSLESFQNHSTTPAHAMKVLLKQAKSSTALTYSNSAINNDELNDKCSVGSTSENSILPELNDNKPYLSHGSCDICKKIFSGPEPYKQHLESQAHKKKVALQQNPTCEGNVLKCEPCEKSFSGQMPYAQHMCSEVHKRKLQNIQFLEKYLQSGNSNSQAAENREKQDENKLWFCNICKVQCSGMIPYQQHVEGNTHFKNERKMQSLQHRNMPQLISGNCQVDNGRSQNNFLKTDDVMNSMMQTSNSNEGEISKKSENTSQIMNGSYQKDIKIEQNNSLIPGKINELKIVSSDELEDMIKIIHPHEKINFDEIEMPKDSTNEKPDIINQSINENLKEFRKNQNCNDKIFDDGF